MFGIQNTNQTLKLATTRSEREGERENKTNNVHVWHEPLNLRAMRKEPLATQAFLVDSAHSMPLVQSKRI